MEKVESPAEQSFDAACKNVALVNCSAVGRIEIGGADRLDLLHRLSTNNLASAKAGAAVGTVLTTDKGRVVDYVHVAVRESSLLLLTSPRNESRLCQWIEKYTIMEDVRLNAVTNSTAMMRLVGPQAKSFVELVMAVPLAANSCREVTLPFGSALVLHRTEFVTEFVDMIVESSKREPLLTLLRDNNAIAAVEMDAPTYEMFRITRGIPAMGAELSDAYNPYEANLRHAISFTKGCYIGQEVIARLDTYQKVQKNLFGLLFYGRNEISAGATVQLNGEDVGVVTSVCNEAIRNASVALAILKKNDVHADDNVSVVSDGKRTNGVVRGFPIVL